jgi:hypothetical protein
MDIGNGEQVFGRGGLPGGQREQKAKRTDKNGQKPADTQNHREPCQECAQYKDRACPVKASMRTICADSGHFVTHADTAAVCRPAPMLAPVAGAD